MFYTTFHTIPWSNMSLGAVTIHSQSTPFSDVNMLFSTILVLIYYKMCTTYYFIIEHKKKLVYNRNNSVREFKNMIIINH